jgi:hypothetical protein
MWWFFGIVIAFILFKFFGDVQTQNNQLSKEGGVRHKYATLITYIMASLNGGHIFSETTDSIVLGKSNPLEGTFKYYLVQTFSKLTIQYKMDSKVFGKHSFEWVFDENEKQIKMFEKMNEDVTNKLFKP